VIGPPISIVAVPSPGTVPLFETAAVMVAFVIDRDSSTGFHRVAFLATPRS
jgi:hypothetical protein